MLNDTQFVADLLGAYSQTTWLAYGTNLAAAINAYIMSGAVETSVSGVASGPSGPYPVSGSGLGVAVPAGFAVFEQTVKLASTTSELWLDFAEALSAAISALIDSSVITTAVTGGCAGAGLGTISSAPGLSIFEETCLVLFQTSETNTKLVLDFKNAINALLLSSVVTTVDSGATPHPWSGTGSGGIS